MAVRDGTIQRSCGVRRYSVVTSGNIRRSRRRNRISDFLTDLTSNRGGTMTCSVQTADF
ncbi:hypothetical protein YC2023_054134 [Brassica napus]